MAADPDTERDEAAERRSLFNRLTAFETTLIAGGVLLFVVLLYEMEAFLSPPLIGMAGALLLWPLREHRAARALLISGGFLLGMWTLDRLGGILIPFALAYLLAFLLDPLVSYGRARWNLPRWLSSLAATLLALGALALLVVLLIPRILSQIQTLGVRIVDSIRLLREWLATTPWVDTLEQMGVVESREAIIQQVNQLLQNQAGALTNRLPEAAQRLFASLESVLGTLTTLSIIPVVLFYTLKDYPFIKERLVELFPTFGGRRDYLVEAGAVVGSYMRGMVIIMIIAAVNVSFWFVVLDVPFGLLLGILAGLLNIIPNLGALITNIIALLVVLIFGDPWYLDAIKVLVVLLGQGLLEQTILTPNILSHQVGLHPVLILLALFVFGYFLGLFGLLIAVPATALIMMVYKAYRDEWNFDMYHYTTVPEPRQITQWPLQQEEDAEEEPSSDASSPE